MLNDDKYTFNISLSILNHLGRNLYRSFITIIGEAISNSWDADADNVFIYIDKNTDSLVVKDDGIGMTSDDFQNKFLKIGYSKRKSGKKCSDDKKRPFIGRKGIGKLALLSCAKKVTIISKTKGGEYIGGLIDNSELDKHITEDHETSKYKLDDFDFKKLKPYTEHHSQGTIIYFENIHEGLKNSLEFLRKIIALYFRFSLIDKSFSIFLENEEITVDDLQTLAEKTEFLWNINSFDDPYIKDKLAHVKENKPTSMEGNVKGFIASVKKPRDLKIYSVNERAGIDLFVNGRLRERDILKHIPSSRIVENYLYGQIHYDEFDSDETDRFASSREGVIVDDEKYAEFLENLKKVVSIVIEDWDIWRVKHGEEGDSENTRLPKRNRKSRELYNVVSDEYEIKKLETSKDSKDKVNSWIADLAEDAEFNFPAYADCFISENLIRKHIEENKIQLSPEAEEEIKNMKDKEEKNKQKANISISIRENNVDLSYLSMNDLANLVDKTTQPTKEAALARDAIEYKPIRDALMHTALLTDEAKNRLSTTYSNIKGRLRTLLLKE